MRVSRRSGVERLREERPAVSKIKRTGIIKIHVEEKKAIKATLQDERLKTAS